MFELSPFGRRERGLLKDFDNFEKSFFGSLSDHFADFRTDILDKGDHYLLQAELPGFEKEDIHIDIEGDYLTISARHNTEKEEKDHHYVRQERSFSSYSRSFPITDVKTEQITAAYKNGILEMNLPKNEKQSPPSHRIEIN